jgi:GNAT superfamily N-acetyltransferase
MPGIDLPRIDLGAWCASHLVGVGSLVCDGTGTWEAAMLVEDAWQHRGVGGRLADGLVQLAGERGVDTVTLSAQVDSMPVVRLLRRRALRLAVTWQGSGVVEYRAELSPPRSTP